MKWFIAIIAIFGYLVFLSYYSRGNLIQNQSGNNRVESTYDESSERYAPNTFYGYECTDDCSGHEAGYEWAGENNITHLDMCGGNSQSFIEGCESYVMERTYPDEIDENYAE